MNSNENRRTLPAAGWLSACVSLFCLLPLFSLLPLLSLSACSGTEAQETAYPNGARESRAVHLRASGGPPVRHGVQLSWYPDGGRKSMETFVHGYRQGYAFRWYPDGKPEAVERFADGVRNGQAKYWDASGALVGCIDASGRDCLEDPAGGGASSRRLALRP